MKNGIKITSFVSNKNATRVPNQTSVALLCSMTDQRYWRWHTSSSRTKTKTLKIVISVHGQEWLMSIANVYNLNYKFDPLLALDFTFLNWFGPPIFLTDILTSFPDSFSVNCNLNVHQNCSNAWKLAVFEKFGKIPTNLYTFHEKRPASGKLVVHPNWCSKYASHTAFSERHWIDVRTQTGLPNWW